MKATVYLHIGMHKTGTTSIQATLFKNRERLLAHDINYLSINQNHSESIYPLVCERPHLYHVNKLVGIDTEEKAAQRNASIDSALKSALESNTCSRFVISGEDLFQLEPGGIERLKQKLEPYAAGYRVVVYVREPYGYITSAFQQRLRAGATYEELIERSPLPRYRRIQHFIDAFGRDRVDIRVFEQPRFVAGDLIADFLAAIGSDPDIAKDLDIVRANEALSYEAALILNEVNKRLPRTEIGLRNPDRAVKLPQTLEAVVGQRFRCPSAVYAAARPRVAHHLQWLRAVLGESVFSDEPPQDSLTPVWNEETLASLGLLINELANQVAEARSSRGRQDLRQAFTAVLPAVGKALGRWTKAAS